ncbi:pyrimidine utilization protein D [Rhizobium paknamense]|uniref:Putative carbamate hydrolase RutD n=1 Tax=Rhizobium paknamense TaxID=1206817 RepID=A0ABU0IFG5_9HYPH|nr:pyrimidine utilization protein D [Rhizobium paknamense]MDQ0456442.1 aminoacrylate hydrolase [Rhizobium paknamense]
MHYDVHGENGPALILSSGLGGSAGYWAAQLQALTPHFRVITYDHRGCGRTGGEVPPDGGIRAMAEDVLEIADTLGLSSFHLMGHALGGLIGLDLALRCPERLESLVLINAWSKADPHSGRCFDIRLELLEKSGIPAFLKAQPLFLYPAWWMSEQTERLAQEEAHGLAHFQGETNIRRRIAALRAFNVDDRLGAISTRTLVLATRDDLLVPYQRSLRLAEGLPDATLELMESGGHAVNVVHPETFNKTVVDFLRR